MYPKVQFQIYELINRKQPGKLSQHCLFDKTRSLRVPVKILHSLHPKVKLLINKLIST